MKLNKNQPNLRFKNCLIKFIFNFGSGVKAIMLLSIKKLVAKRLRSKKTAAPTLAKIIVNRFNDVGAHL